MHIPLQRPLICHGSVWTSKVSGEKVLRHGMAFDMEQTVIWWISCTFVLSILPKRALSAVLALSGTCHAR